MYRPTEKETRQGFLGSIDPSDVRKSLKDFGEKETMKNLGFSCRNAFMHFCKRRFIKLEKNKKGKLDSV